MRDTLLKQRQYTNANIGLSSRSNVITNALHLFLLTAAFILWANSLPHIDPSHMGNLGLVSVLPVTFFLALIVLSISFLTAIYDYRTHYLVLIAHIVMLIFMFHGTPQIVYGTLRYSWAWKHVGIVDYIQRHGSVNPLINNLNAYHNWPGFFALAAYLNQAAGLQSALSYAGWGPVFFNLLDLGALMLLYRQLTVDRRLAWLSVWLFYLFNWVGQDYFSPQAFTFFLYIVTIAILLKWFRADITRYRDNFLPLSRFKRLNELYRNIVKRSILSNVRISQSNPSQRIFMMGIVVLILFVIAASHQLTPLMLLSGLTLLVLFQVSNQRFLPLLAGIATIVWVIFLAVGFLDGNLSWVVRSFGSFFQNINGNLLNLSAASADQQLIAKVDRGLSALAWIIGLAGLYRRYRAGHWDLIAVLLMVTPLPMLVLNAYGGEMLFRVYLFSLPFVAFLAAGLFYPRIDLGTSYRTHISTVLISLFLIIGFLFGYYGKESMYYFSPGEVAAARFIYKTAPQGSLIVDGTWNWPRQYVNYEEYNYLSVAGFSRDEELKIIHDPAAEFSKLMDDAGQGTVFTNPDQPVRSAQETPGAYTSVEKNDYPAAYLVITRSQIAEAGMTGVLPSDWLANLAHTLIQSSSFKIVFSNPDAVILQYEHTYEPAK